jgi:hypothetical protein
MGVSVNGLYLLPTMVRADVSCTTEDEWGKWGARGACARAIEGRGLL